MQKMKYVLHEQKKCEHEIDESTVKFVPGKGYEGICKKCGAKLIQMRLHAVQPRQKPHLSKKQRRKLRITEKED